MGVGEKMANVQYYGTGRRKSSTARVFLRNQALVQFKLTAAL